jgi:Ankyrin repeats (3 copies)
MFSSLAVEDIFLEIIEYTFPGKITYKNEYDYNYLSNTYRENDEDHVINIANRLIKLSNVYLTWKIIIQNNLDDIWAKHELISSKALISFTKHNYYFGVKKNLEHDIKVDATCRNPLTPLQIASQNGNLKIVKLLLKYGADINEYCQMGGGLHSLVSSFYFRSFNTYTPLAYACYHGHLNIILYLIKNKAKINCGRSIIELIIDYYPRDYKYCPAVSMENKIKIIKLLIHNGIELNNTFIIYHSNTQSKCILDLALSAMKHNPQYIEIIELLLQNGADSKLSQCNKEKLYEMQMNMIIKMQKVKRQNQIIKQINESQKYNYRQCKIQKNIFFQQTKKYIKIHQNLTANQFRIFQPK